MGRITVSHKLRAAWMEKKKMHSGASQPLVEAETSPRLLLLPLSCWCKVTELYCAALSLCPAAGDGWDSFCPRLPSIEAPLRLQTVAAEHDCFIGLRLALSIAH